MFKLMFSNGTCRLCELSLWYNPIFHREALFLKSEFCVSCGGQQMDDLQVTLESVTEEKDRLQREVQLSTEKVSAHVL